MSYLNFNLHHYVSGSLQVIQIKAAEDDLSCPISAVSEGQCGTGTYIYEHTAADTAGNEAMARMFRIEISVVHTRPDDRLEIEGLFTHE
jgi:hypothetical protein